MAVFVIKPKQRGDDAQDDPCKNDDDAQKMMLVKTTMMLKLWC